MGISKNNINAEIQSSVDNFFQYTGIQEIKNDITLTSQVNIDDEIINVSPGHGFQVGELLTIWENTRFEQAEVTNVTVNAITIDIPSGGAFTVGGALVVRGNSNLNLNGSVTPIDVLFKMYNSFVPVDISNVIMIIQHATEPDDSKFGNLGALTNGVFFREINGQRTNMGTYKKNIDFKLKGGIVNYTDKAGGGAFSTEIIFDLKKIFGRELRLNPRKNEHICGRIRDDLTGLALYKISMTGSFTEGE